MKNFLKKLWSNRQFRTFLQGFVVTFCTGYFTGIDIDGLKALIMSCLMAGLSALMNVIGTGDE